MAVQYYEGVGRRKQSTARVRVMSGAGNFIVNEKSLDGFFTRLGDVVSILAPLEAVGYDRGTFDITVKVRGGGVTGQTEAVRLGLARALIKMNPDDIASLRKGGYLTRDPRVKERKKPGLKKARKAPTYTKR
ncbi:MAG: 30S ribosomal protein S9 [Anaerolineaceae bacterium]|nr:30S ribosomal protein S9 [Anaerolineaceae bacterium]